MRAAAILVGVALAACSGGAEDSCLEVTPAKQAIVVDGEIGDWAAVKVAVTDPAEQPAALRGGDLGSIYLAADGDKLFVRVDLAGDLSQAGPDAGVAKSDGGAGDPGQVQLSLGVKTLASKRIARLELSRDAGTWRLGAAEAKELAAASAVAVKAAPAGTVVELSLPRGALGALFSLQVSTERCCVWDAGKSSWEALVVDDARCLWAR
jgi:hypothetical protein